MRVLVCGDREWNDPLTIAKRLRRYEGSPTTIVHGDARGADRTAQHVARSLRLPVEAFPADWKKYGKAAGPIRNREMLDTKPDIVLAFHDNLDASLGTRDCVEEARRRGIPVEVISSAYAAWKRDPAAP